MKKYLAIAAAGGALAIGVPAAFAATDAPENTRQHARAVRDADADSRTSSARTARTARRRTAAAAAAARTPAPRTEI